MASSSKQMKESSPSLSGLTSPSTEHDVYISFKPTDTRIFVDHLRTAFSLAGIPTFYHSSQPETEEISPEIKASKVIIVVLSLNYASSRWCLDELVEILRLNRAGAHEMIPVCYHIDPTHLRYQTGEFGLAFRKNMAKNKEVEKIWLKEVGKLSEFYMPISSSRVVDRKLISRIVKRVKLGISDPEKLELDRPQSTSFPRKFMNLGSQVFYNIQKSSTRNRLLNIITRQADKMEIQLDFPKSECTLSDVQELLGQLEKVLKRKLPTLEFVAVRNLKVMNIRSYELPGIPDNISFPDLEELYFEELFLESTIDSDMLSSFFKGMPALKILDMSNTYLTTLPPSIFRLIKLEQLVLQYACLMKLPGVLPALWNLKVLDLSGCTNLFELPESKDFPQSLCTLDLTDCIRLRKLPESISRLRSLEYLYLSGCSSLLEFHAKNVSINRLSNASQADKTEVQLDFHDRFSISGQFDQPEIQLELHGRNKRLYDNIDSSLYNITELLGLMENVFRYKLLQSKFLAVMNLKEMHIGSELSEFPDNLSFPNLEKLFLQPYFDLKDIPFLFFERMPALQVLDMSNTSINTLPPSVLNLLKLKKLYLRCCILLIELPQINAIWNLEELDLSGCTNLVKIAVSVEFLQSLSLLNLKDCTSLTKLPKSVSKLKSLCSLNLSGCANLAEIPESIGFLDRLSSLDLTNCKRLTKLPDNLSNLKFLSNLCLSGCSGLSEYHAVEVSINRFSAASQADIPEVHLDFHGRDGTLTDITELLGLMRKVLEYKLLQSKSVAVVKLKVMHVRNSKLSEIPDNLSFPHLEKLFIQSDLNLSNIPSSLFERIPALKFLSITNRRIKTLPRFFFQLIKLEELHLRGCEQLIELPHEIIALGNLKVFDLSGCTHLAEIPNSLNFPQSLSSLDLRDCGSLTKLPENISKLRSLKYLYFSGCTKLVEIPESIEMLESISSLDLTNCKSLTKLPKGISKLRSLQHLDLSGCINLSEIPESIEFFERLTSLVLRDCSSLTKVPESISKMRSLRYLNLHGCSNLAEISESIELLEGLYSLNLTYCGSLRKLPEDMHKLSSLRYLYLSGCSSLYEFHAPEVSINRLSTSSQADKMEVHLDFHGKQGTLFDITELLGLMKKVLEYKLLNSRSAAVMNLNVMHIGTSELSELPDNLSFPNLQELLLKSTLDLSYVPSSFFERMPALKVLEISNKSITTLPLSVSKLIKLEELVLRDCELLMELPPELGALGNLKNLVLSGCTALAEIPDSIDFPRSLFSLDLSDCKSLTELPKGVSKLTSLQKVDLSGCLNLFEVPTSLFEKLPPLQVLDMSNTSIKTLPSWIFKLTELEELILRGCELLLELPGEIGALGNLKVLDLEGTNLVSLPMTLGGLIKLKCLKFSLHDGEIYRRNKDIVEIIPKAILLNLTQLEELSINVDPHVTWCNAAVAAILNDLLELRNLETLKLYLPTVELLQNLLRLVYKNDDLPIYQRLSNFCFTIGPHAQRFISRLPCELEEEFLKMKKCLKYINGRDSTTIFAEALKHANALYLDRHWTIQKLSVFKFEDLTELKFCLMVDCNEMQTVFDGTDFNLGVANNEDKILSLQYLAIHYLKNLENIWRAPGVGCCLQSLKVLVLHMCPNLTTIFTPVLLGDLVNLKEIIVEDCPKIRSLIAEESTQLPATEYLPRLKRLSLFYMPELESISRGISFGPELENIVIYDCPKLKRFPSLGVRNEDAIKIKGESEWWNALEWEEPEWRGGQPPYLHRAFSEIDSNGDCLDELAPQYGNSLRLFVKECDAN